MFFDILRYTSWYSVAILCFFVLNLVRFSFLFCCCCVCVYRWAEISLLLRKPILQEEDMLYTVAAAEAGLMYTEEVMHSVILFECTLTVVLFLLTLHERNLAYF